MNVNFNTYTPNNSNPGHSNTNNVDFKVTPLTIADGESTLVRFPYKSVNDFDLRTIHIVKLGNRYKKVDCLGSVDNCPLCARGDRIQSRLFARLLQYNQTTQGIVEVKSKIFDAPYSIANSIAEYVKAYGDISNLIFKLSRSGIGSDTRYNLITMPTEMYPETVYKKDFSDFDNFNLPSFFCMQKNKEEMQAFVDTGDFPQGLRNSNSTTLNTPPIYDGTNPTPTNNIPMSGFEAKPMEEVLQEQQITPGYIPPVTRTVAPATVATPVTPTPTFSSANPPLNQQANYIYEQPLQQEAPRPRRYQY